MEKIKIVTDSTADLPAHIIEKYDIEVLPLLVNFEDKSYLDGVDIKLHELLNKMDESSEFPRTSQVSPIRFQECYMRLLNEGYKIISIHLSSKMSGTYQSACIAKEMTGSDDVIVIDSLNATSGLGLLVIKAAKLKEQGLPASGIAEEIKKAVPHVKSALAFGSLDNLVKGGRLPKAVGVIGNILGIKVIIDVEDGIVVVKDKVRGSKKAARTILDYIESIGIKDGEPSILLDVENEDIQPALKESLQEYNKEFIECKVGCVIGVHAGRGACGIFFIENY